MSRELQSMPCPECGTLMADDTGYRNTCECGAELQKFVPIFYVQAMPYGWRWEVLTENRKLEPTFDVGDRIELVSEYNSKTHGVDVPAGARGAIVRKDNSDALVRFDSLYMNASDWFVQYRDMKLISRPGRETHHV
jgi:hypothetical protein